jgi:hypothetical protein
VSLGTHRAFSRHVERSRTACCDLPKDADPLGSDQSLPIQTMVVWSAPQDSGSTSSTIEYVLNRGQPVSANECDDRIARQRSTSRAVLRVTRHSGLRRYSDSPK